MNIGRDESGRSQQVQALHNAVEAEFESLQMPWLQQLVEIPSHTYAAADVEQAYVPLDSMAEELGMAICRHADPESRFADHRVYLAPGVAANSEGLPSQPVLALVGHVDTVFPRDLGFLKFQRGSGRAAGGTPVYASGGPEMFGPGVLDMKSGLCAMFFACRAIAKLAPELWRTLPLALVVVSDEEVGSPSSRDLFGRLAAQVRAALVFEGGRVEDRIITSRKGGGSFTMTAHGRAAHAGNDHASGVNAIAALATLIPRIEALTDYERGVTVNTGLIEGGTAKNTVPEKASCVLDTRFETRADADALVAQLKQLAADGLSSETVGPRLSQARFELTGRVTRYPMESTPQNRRLAALYGACAESVGLGSGEAPRQGGGSDANLLADAGVPCIDGLGPMGKFFHRVEEWSSVESLLRRTQALAQFMVIDAGLNAAMALTGHEQ